MEDSRQFLVTDEKLQSLFAENANNGIRLAAHFITGLPQDVFPGGAMGGDFRGANEEKVAAYFREHSYMLKELMDNPGTFAMPECIYRGEGRDKGWVDDYLSRSPSGQALLERLHAVIDNTEKIVAKKQADGGSGCVKIINLGSGTGRDTIDMMARNLHWNGSVRVDCFDTDEAALDSGKILAEERAVSGVTFSNGNILALPNREEYDVGLLIGVLCGIPAPQCAAILKKIRPYFKKGGVLIASNVMTRMTDEDPFMAYILDRFVGWKLVYKTEEELRRIFERAGYEWQGCFHDEPNRFHCMGIGVVL